MLKRREKERLYRQGYIIPIPISQANQRLLPKSNGKAEAFIKIVSTECLKLRKEFSDVCWQYRWKFDDTEKAEFKK